MANGVAEDDVINVPPGIYQTPEVSMVGANASRITIVGAGANTTFWEPTGTNRLLILSRHVAEHDRCAAISRCATAGRRRATAATSSSTVSQLHAAVACA